MSLAQPAVAQQKTRVPPEFVTWPAVSDAERELKAPIVEKDAGAEILLWRVHVVDELLGSNRDLQRVFYHYIRLKIFDEKGKEKTSTIDLAYRSPGAILDVAGRTIQPDGTILELDKKTVYKRDLVRAGGIREKVVSFAMPGVERGAIVEYRWMQTEDDNRFRYVRLHFQREFPVQKVAYFVKPLSGAITGGEQMFLMHFNCEPSPIKMENDGYDSTTLENVPASHREPYAPSTPNLEPWGLLYYREGGPAKDPEKFWNEEGKKAYKQLKDLLKSNDELKSGASEAVSGINGDTEKVAALVAYLRKHVRNLSDPELTGAERERFFEQLPKNRRRDSAEIFKSGIGTSDEMNITFAALAMNAGLEARPVLVGDRSGLVFNRNLVDRYFLDNTVMAVKIDNAWKIFDVSNKWLAPGMLSWNEQGMYALVTDSKSPTFIPVPLSSPEESLDRRTARLQLSADGSLAGDVEESYTGHRGEDYRQEIGRKSAAQREEWLKDRVTAMFPEADVTGIQLENVDDAAKALVARYHFEAPRFAQVTGKRLLFQPIVFRRGQGSPFTASERRFAVEFPYGWKESDQVSIRLPQGFVLDNADSPGDLNLGKPGAYHVKMIVTKGSSSELQVTREFTFGNEGNIYYQAKDYSALKGVFDAIEVRDRHAISLKGN